MNDERRYRESGQQCQWHREKLPAQCPNPGMWSSQIPISLCQHHRNRLIEDVGSEYFRSVNAIFKEHEAAEEERETARRIRRIEEIDAERAARSVVYYVQRHDGAIKIGVTTNLAKRLSDFVRVTPVTLLATMRGTRTAEQAMHRRFAADRIGGEWFNPSPSLLAHIDLLQLRAAKREAA